MALSTVSVAVTRVSLRCWLLLWHDLNCCRHVVAVGALSDRREDASSNDGPNYLW